MAMASQTCGPSRAVRFVVEGFNSPNTASSGSGRSHIGEDGMPLNLLPAFHDIYESQSGEVSEITMVQRSQKRRPCLLQQSLMVAMASVPSDCCTGSEGKVEDHSSLPGQSLESALICRSGKRRDCMRFDAAIACRTGKRRDCVRQGELAPIAQRVC